MKKRRLLIIGAGIEQIRAYSLAHEMGLETVGSDANPDAPAFFHADQRIIASTRDALETVAAVKAFHARFPIDGVMTLANDVPLTVACTAVELGLPGIPVAAARIASDKLLMKLAFKGQGIAVPPYREVFEPRDIAAVAEQWGFPLVLKPVDGRGARGVLKLTPEIDLQWAFAHAVENSDHKRVFVEKFIDGKQLSTESMVYGGSCYTASISDRNYELIDTHAPFIIENGGILPADISPADTLAIDTMISKAAQAMGIENGTVKGDIVLSTEGPLIIEMAARLSGGYLCTDQIPLARGVDLVYQTIKLALGEPLDPTQLIPRDICKMGIRYFFPRPGRIVDIRGFDELSQFDWVSKKMMLMKIGDVVERPTNHTQRAGFVHVTGQTLAQAEERAIFAANQVVIETIPA